MAGKRAPRLGDRRHPEHLQLPAPKPPRVVVVEGVTYLVMYDGTMDGPEACGRPRPPREES